VEARYAGMKETPKGFVDGKGKPLDEKAQYAVATSDFLYFGGDGFALKQADGGTPLVTDVAQQAAVIEWTRKLGSTEALPLEVAMKKK
jgi:2',3'-cyclic-nucleotide 2'-phosphodiesterase (5'-nucleotidase family)